MKLGFDEANPYFEPHMLSVKILYKSEDQVESIIGTDIQWKDVDPTKRMVKKKQKHKKTGEIRTIETVKQTESFFNIFQTKKLGDADGMDSDEEAELRDRIDEVQQIVEDFNDLLVPDCLEHYLGLN